MVELRYCSRLEQGDCDDTDKCRAYGCRWIRQPEPFVADPDFTLYVGDVREVLSALPEASVHCCVTSPPYWGLRDYGADGQIGLETTPEAYVAELVEVFRGVHRVLRDDGTVWLNLGDTYAGNRSYQVPQTLHGHSVGNSRGMTVSRRRDDAPVPRSDLAVVGAKPKDLLGIPWRVAFALQADGWYLRSDIIWAKPNPMPESVTDRPTKAHEYLFLLSKSPRYFYDADAIAEPAAWDRWGDQTIGPGSHTWIQPKKKLTGGAYNPPGQTPHGNARKAAATPRNDGERWNGNNGRGFVPVRETRNKRSVWEVPTESYPEAHFATFPTALVEPCIKAGCSAGGTVLDPFMGSGTTALVARRLGRKSIGVELNPEYAKLAAKRLQQLSLLADAEEVA